MLTKGIRVRTLGRLQKHRKPTGKARNGQNYEGKEYYFGEVISAFLTMRKEYLTLKC